MKVKKPPAAFKGCAVWVWVLLFSASLLSKTIRVPTDFPTIEQGVKAAESGDTVEVENGVYFGENIILDKPILIKSANPFGAIIQGTQKELNAIFVVQAPVEIQGFVLRDTQHGILQRNSPDAAWKGHDLVFMDIGGSSVYINDRENHIGEAFLENIIILNSHAGVSTNDAGGINLRSSIIANCVRGLIGFNHKYFTADEILFLNCSQAIQETNSPAQSPGKNTIDLGEEIFVVDEKEDQPQKIIQDFFRNKFRFSNNWFFFTLIGDTYSRLNELTQAETWYNKARQAALSLELADQEWRAVFRLARINRRLNKPQKALVLYREAVSIIEKIRVDFTSFEHRQKFFQYRTRIFEELIELLFELHQKKRSGRYAEEALYYSEKIKARTLLDKMELKQEVTDADIRDLLKGFQSAPLTYEQISQNIPSDTVWMAYFLGNEFSFVFALTRDKSVFKKLTPSKKLTESVENYLLFLTLEDQKQFYGQKGAQILYDELIRPVQDVLVPQVKKVVIIPDGILFKLPFETLIETSEETDIKENRKTFLIERYEISYAVSASSLAKIYRKKPWSSKNQYLVLSNPQEVEVEKSLKEGWKFADKKEKNNLSENQVIYSLNLSPLKYAEAEAKSIARILDRSQTQVLLDRQATKGNFFQSLGQDYDIIHLAAHSVYDQEDWWQSFVLFWSDKSSHEKTLLKPIEVFRSRIKANLVVLSSCQSGISKTIEGEGLLGFVWAFKGAGARSVLSSLWKIKDKAAYRFMKSFYNNLAQGMSKAQALKKTKCEMIHSSFRHPQYWSLFVLYGESLSGI
jgi:CHAT domain-containing protein